MIGVFVPTFYSTEKFIIYIKIKTSLLNLFNICIVPNETTSIVIAPFRIVHTFFNIQNGMSSPRQFPLFLKVQFAETDAMIVCMVIV